MTGPRIRRKAAAIGALLVATGSLCGCVIGPAQVALSLGSSVASRVIVDRYRESGIGQSHPPHPSESSRTVAFEACLDGFINARNESAQLDQLDWCLQSEISAEERTRVLVAQASIALAYEDSHTFRRAASALEHGTLMTVHGGEHVDLVAVVKGLANGRVTDNTPPFLQRSLR